MRVLLLTLLFAGAWATAQAQDPAAVFDAAVSSYQRGRFDTAAVGFTQLARSGVDDARLWYNLGNAHFKSGHIGAAMVSYRRGMRLAPRDPDLNANFRYVRLFAIDKIEPVGELFVATWWRRLIDRLSLQEARWLAGSLFWLAGLLTVWKLWPTTRGDRSMPRWILAAVWCLWLVVTGAAATCYARDVSSRDGFVVGAQTDIRGGPGDEYALQFVAHDGLAGTVERTESGWHLVRFPNGLKGWLAAQSFELI